MVKTFGAPGQLPLLPTPPSVALTGIACSWSLKCKYMLDFISKFVHDLTLLNPRP